MSEIKDLYKEKSFELYYDWHRFAFSFGYSFSEGCEDKPNLIWLEVAFWQIDYAW